MLSSELDLGYLQKNDMIVSVNISQEGRVRKKTLMVTKIGKNLGKGSHEKRSLFRDSNLSVCQKQSNDIN